MTRGLRATLLVPSVVIITALGLAMATLPASAAKKNNTAKLTVEKPPKATISETGSTLLYPLFNLWVPGYNQTYPQVTIQTAGTGSGTGITDASNGTVEIGASDAYLSPSDLQATPTLMNIPLAISAQLIAYNVPGVTTHLKLNGKVLDGMYTGTIKSWNNSAIAKLNPGVKLPNIPVVTLHRSDGSGDTFLFTTYLSKTNSSWATKVGYNTTVAWPAAPGALAEDGNSGMVSGCKATPGCIAYIGISYLSQMLGDGLEYAQVQNAKGNYIMPTPATIEAEASSFVKKTPPSGTISLIYGPAAKGYPIINYEYGIVDKHQASSSTAKAVRSVLEWAINPKDGNSPSYLDQVNFQALPKSVSTQSIAQIRKVQ